MLAGLRSVESVKRSMSNPVIASEFWMNIPILTCLPGIPPVKIGGVSGHEVEVSFAMQTSPVSRAWAGGAMCVMGVGIPGDNVTINSEISAITAGFLFKSLDYPCVSKLLASFCDEYIAWEF